MAPLTEEILIQHNLLISEQKISTEESHAAKVVKWEKIHQAHYQLGDTMGHKIVLDSDPFDDDASKHTSLQETEFSCNLELSLLDQSASEGPLERFFTPDGCSDPCYLSRDALGTQFANEDSVEARRLHAEMCVEIIVQNENANKGSTHA
ncbi:uncharacterized protein TRUGW13939_04519 [Talaromyces rugulosus]|uniref:Uncharacterized protein n=1 Tax=Talaromyces rugulosus TaxID=121627 RepID=A0A7H8QTW6_TALRU|nr:uncharacterized protein TRUGW13939_04519 [Talaromyces rugulosus]QKX57407.1 hypothetical protein TRUGW13939_04519 [Talaromyces rugulosus]